MNQNRSSDRGDVYLPWVRVFRRSAFHAKKICLDQSGFSLVELVTVVIIAGLIMGTVTIMYYQTARKTEQRAAAEILKQDIRKVCTLAESGDGVVDGNNVRHRDKYRIVFHTKDDDPPNCYKILRSRYNTETGTYPIWTSDEVDVIAEKHHSIKIIDGTWIKPATSNDVEITALSENMTEEDGERGITFESKGSIIQTDALGDCSVTLSSKDNGASATITVSLYGSIVE